MSTTNTPTLDPRHDALFRFMIKLRGAMYRASESKAGNPLKTELFRLYQERGARAGVDHFLRCRRQLSGRMWRDLRATPTWKRVPEAERVELEAMHAALYQAPRLPVRAARTERFGDVLTRWECMVDQLAAELITPDQFKADLRAVLGRQGDRRRRL
jgi:hypothetical protein